MKRTITRPPYIGVLAVGLALFVGFSCGPTVGSGADGGSSDAGGSTVAVTPPGNDDTGPGMPATTTGSTTGVVSTADTSSSDDAADDRGFITDPDTLCNAELTCDLWAQDCPKGEKCTPWGPGCDHWSAIRCSVVQDEPDQPGEECTTQGVTSGQDSCDVGSVCWHVDPATNVGTCVSLCQGGRDAPVCAPDFTCVELYDEASLCLRVCDPLASECGPDRACVPDAAAAPTTFVCMGTAIGLGAATGQMCREAHDCQPGNMCLSDELRGDGCDPDVREGPCDPPCSCAPEGVCTAYCDLSAPDPVAPCADPTHVCMPLADPSGLPAAYDDVGLCVLPR